MSTAEAPSGEQAFLLAGNLLLQASDEDRRWVEGLFLSMSLCYGDPAQIPALLGDSLHELVAMAGRYGIPWDVPLDDEDLSSIRAHLAGVTK